MSIVWRIDIDVDLMEWWNTTAQTEYYNLKDFEQYDMANWVMVF